MKQIFMESAVHVVARDGLEKTTTKAIAAQAGLNVLAADLAVHFGKA